MGKAEVNEVTLIECKETLESSIPGFQYQIFISRNRRHGFLCAKSLGEGSNVCKGGPVIFHYLFFS